MRLITGTTSTGLLFSASRAVEPYERVERAVVVN